MKTLLPPTEVTSNETPELHFFRLSILKNAQGLSPLSSASLYRRTHSSTPCAMLANSLDSTLLSRYSMISGGSVTLRDCFLRLGAMHSRLLQISINTPNQDAYNALITSAGLTENERNQPYSASADRRPADRTDDNLTRPHSMRWVRNRHRGHTHLFTEIRTQGAGSRTEAGSSQNVSEYYADSVRTGILRRFAA